MDYKIIKARCAIHAQGTKFYEIVLLQHTQSREVILIRRYGKTGVLARGGATQITVGANAISEYNYLDRSKYKPTEYSKADGLFAAGSAFAVHGHTIGTVLGVGSVYEQYAATSQASEVLRILKVNHAPSSVLLASPADGADNNGIAAASVLHKKPEKPKPAGWGAW